jgi:hypothetical protein
VGAEPEAVINALYSRGHSARVFVVGRERPQQRQPRAPWGSLVGAGGAPAGEADPAEAEAAAPWDAGAGGDGQEGAAAAAAAATAEEEDEAGADEDEEEKEPWRRLHAEWVQALAAAEIPASPADLMLRFPALLYFSPRHVSSTVATLAAALGSHAAMADLVTTHPRLLSAGAMSLHRRLILLHTLCGAGLPRMLRATPALLDAPLPTLQRNAREVYARTRSVGECWRFVEANPQALLLRSLADKAAAVVAALAAAAPPGVHAASLVRCRPELMLAPPHSVAQALRSLPEDAARTPGWRRELEQMLAAAAAWLAPAATAGPAPRVWRMQRGGRAVLDDDVQAVDAADAEDDDKEEEEDSLAGGASSAAAAAASEAAYEALGSALLARPWARKRLHFLADRHPAAAAATTFVAVLSAPREAFDEQWPDFVPWHNEQLALQPRRAPPAPAPPLRRRPDARGGGGGAPRRQQVRSGTSGPRNEQEDAFLAWLSGAEAPPPPPRDGGSRP